MSGRVIHDADDPAYVAAQYATDFDIVINTMACGLAVREHRAVERAIIEMQLYMLFRNGDDLIRRKLGENTGVSRLAAIEILNSLDTPQGGQAYRDFDAFLRSDNHARNPGTTADLIAAALFVALREKQIDLATPFVWDEHPFG